MTDKKLSDNEIIKALECVCGNVLFCQDCPYSKTFPHKKTGKGYMCQLDPQKRVLDMDYKDTTSKAEWHPLKEMAGEDNA